MRLIFATLVLALASLPVMATGTTESNKLQKTTQRTECVRVNQVRAFAVEDENTLVVRQGRSTYRRITVDGDCPLRQADRIGFATTRHQSYIYTTGGRRIPVVETSLTTRFCSATPHAYVVVIDEQDDTRERCKIKDIGEAAEADFEAANPTDNRY